MASSDLDEPTSAILEVTLETKKINNCNKVESCNTSESSANETCLLQSPSAESISTFQDIDKISELVLDSSQDIVAKVDNPQKVVEPLGTYVSFRIRTKCRRWDPDEKEYVVRRRYNDFKALHEKLSIGSLIVIPPLPCRHTLLAQLDRYSRDFVLQRLALLNIFIKRLTTHCIISHSDDLKVFLTASQSEMNSHFKSKTSYLSSISDSLYNFASSNGNPLSSSVACRVRDPEFTSAYDYMTSLKDKLEHLASISSRINKERSGIATEMQNLRPILESWSQTERFNTDTLKINGSKRKVLDEISLCSGSSKPDLDSCHSSSEGGVIQTTNSDEVVSTDVVHCSRPNTLCSATLGEILKKMTKPFSILSLEYSKMVKEYPFNMGNPVQEYILYVDAVRSKLKERDGIQAALEAARDKSNKKPATGIQNSGDRVNKDIEKLHDRLQCSSEALRSDLQGWHRQKNIDIKLILLEMAKKHIEFYQKSLSSWERVLPEVPGTSSSNNMSRKIIPANGDVFLKQMSDILSLGPVNLQNDEISKENSNLNNGNENHNA